MKGKRSRKQNRAIHAKKRKSKKGKAALLGADYFKGKSPIGTNGEAKGFYQGKESLL